MNVITEYIHKQKNANVSKISKLYVNFRKNVAKIWFISHAHFGKSHFIADLGNYTIYNLYDILFLMYKIFRETLVREINLRHLATLFSHSIVHKRERRRKTSKLSRRVLNRFG